MAAQSRSRPLKLPTDVSPDPYIEVRLGDLVQQVNFVELLVLDRSQGLFQQSVLVAQGFLGDFPISRGVALNTNLNRQVEDNRGWVEVKASRDLN